MSSGSLTKFTVPLSGGETSSTQGLLMPKLAYRFRVTFLNFGISTPTSELTKQVVDFKRPSVKMKENVIDVYNSKIYIQGKPEWDAGGVKLRDDATGEVSRMVGEQVQKQFDFMEQSSAASGIDYKFGMKLEMLDGGNGAFEPRVLETWNMYGCFITSVGYGDVSYDDDKPVIIDVSFRFDNAIQDNGIGNNVGRTEGDVTTG